MDVIMEIKNLSILVVSIAAMGIINAPVYAKKIYPAEIMGRDLMIPGLGWACRNF